MPDLPWKEIIGFSHRRRPRLPPAGLRPGLEHPV
jgi:hypothetical protein